MIKLGIIGLGHWGPNYIRNFDYFREEAKVVSVSDLNPASFSKISIYRRDLSFYKDWRKMLTKERLDAIVVSTPASTHPEIAKVCLSNSKHVLIEKPLALKIKDAQEIVKLANNKKKILMVGHTFLYNPAVRKVKECINKNKIGRIYYLQAIRTHLGLVRDDVNAVWDLATHDVSIFNYLLDSQPRSVIACAGEYLKRGRQDVAFVSLYYPGGILGNIQVSWIDSNKVRQVTVVGSKSRVVFNDLDSLEPVRIYEKGISVEQPITNFGEFKLLLRDGDIISPKVEPKEPLSVICKHFIDCIKSGKRPLTDGKNGLEVVRVMCAIEKSLKHKGMRVKI